MRRDGTTALLLGATLGVVGIAMHVTAEAARPTTERLLAGAMSLTPVGYAVWKIGGGSLIALGVLVGARGLFRYRRDARYVQRVEALIGSRDLETEAVNHDQDEPGVAREEGGAAGQALRATDGPSRGDRAGGSRRTVILIVGLGAVALVGNAAVYLATRDKPGRVFSIRMRVHDVARSSKAVLGVPSDRARPLPVFRFPTPARVRPTAVTVMTTNTNGRSRLEGLVWRNWGRDSATATGSENDNDCDPSCAAGSFRRRPGASVRASDLSYSDCGGRLTLFYARLALRSPGSADDRVFVLGPPCR